MSELEKDPARDPAAAESLRQRIAELETRVAAAEASEARYQALLRVIPDLIMRISRDGTYRDFVPAKEIRLLVPGRERIGRRVQDILPPPLPEQYLAAIARAIDTDQTQTFDYVLTIGDRTAAYEARVVKNGADEALLMVRDVSEQRQTELALRQEQERAERLLASILPRPISERLKLGHSGIADGFDEATVLFADLVGFTELSSRIPPGDVVALLNKIFSHFDALSERYGLEKIKTIGDAYMVAGGLPVPRKDHADAVADMALDMLRAVEDVARTQGHPLEVRIGINSGAVVAGIIGTKKFIYDLWGDTVNIASRMESHGQPARIQVTEATRSRLGDRFRFEPRGTITIKGRGAMPTYWLLGRR